jgi:hypothetical protein
MLYFGAKGTMTPDSEQIHYRLKRGLRNGDPLVDGVPVGAGYPGWVLCLVDRDERRCSSECELHATKALRRAAWDPGSR